MRLCGKILLILFLVSLVLPSIIWFFISPNIEIANIDNRKLKEMPSLKSSEIMKFPKEFDRYYNDNLPFRSELISLYSYIVYIFTGHIEAKNVLLGKNGWLFYNNTRDGNPVADYKRINLFTQKELLSIKKNLLDIKKYCEKRNCSFILFICPNKENIYSEYMPDYIIRADDISRTQQLINYLKAHTDIKVIYPKEDLLEAKKDYYVYDKYDTHWNLLGGYIASKSLLENLDIYLPELSSLPKEPFLKKQGYDLANMTGIKEVFLKNHQDIKLIGYEDLDVEYEEIDGVIRKHSKNASKKEKLMIKRDSFALYMIPFIRLNYEDSVYIHSKYFTREMIDKEKPNVFVLQTVERYLTGLKKKI